jgi:hypothetical protein
MNEFLIYYHKVNPTTWAYLSSLLMIGLYFKFSRFWSVRNLDLILLILLAPGLLFVHYGQTTRDRARALAVAEQAAAAEAPSSAESPSAPTPAPPVEESATEGSAAPPTPTAEPRPILDDPMVQDLFPELAAEVPAGAPAPSPAQEFARKGRTREYVGYLWLFIVGGLWLVRLLLDSTMVRRPLLEPNLSPGGLSFLGCALFVFLAANVIATLPDALAPLIRNRPGYAFLQTLPNIPTVSIPSIDVPDVAPQTATVAAVTPPARPVGEAWAKVLVILSQLAIVVAVVGIGYRHFDNLKMGIGAATLYLMLPYTSQMFGLVTHAVPAACLLWAVLCYRRPLTSGVFIGIAASVGYYPFFLLPLWLSFYWQRGLTRFLGGALLGVAVMALLLLFRGPAEFLPNLQSMFGALAFRLRPEDLGGIWSLGWDAVYRLPMLIAFLILAFSFAVWPAQKNLGTLLSCSAAVMIAAQYWHGGYANSATGLSTLDSGGLYMAWYLPLLLLTVFRPNLEDRVALTVLGPGWFPRRPQAAAMGFPRAA